MSDESVTKDCEEQFGKDRGGAVDARLRVELSEDGRISYRWQDMNFVIAREMLQRLVLYMRMVDLFDQRTVPVSRVVNQAVGMMVQVQVEEWLPEKTICMVYHPGANAIRASISGMSPFQACILAESAASEIQREMFNGSTD